MFDLSPSHVHELRRLGVVLDHPDLAARAAGHRFNRPYSLASRRPRHLPADALDRWAKTYARLLEAALTALLDVAYFLAANDYRRRHFIRDAEAACAHATDRALDRLFRSTAQVRQWADAPDSEAFTVYAALLPASTRWVVSR